MSNQIYRTSAYVIEKFSISIKTLDRWVKDKKLNPVYLGEERRFTDSEIERFENEYIKTEPPESTKIRMEKIRKGKEK